MALDGPHPTTTFRLEMIRENDGLLDGAVQVLPPDNTHRLEPLSTVAFETRIDYEAFPTVGVSGETMCSLHNSNHDVCWPGINRSVGSQCGGVSLHQSTTDIRNFPLIREGNSARLERSVSMSHPTPQLASAALSETGGSSRSAVTGSRTGFKLSWQNAPPEPQRARPFVDPPNCVPEDHMGLQTRSSLAQHSSLVRQDLSSTSTELDMEESGELSVSYGSCCLQPRFLQYIDISVCFSLCPTDHDCSRSLVSFRH